ncbi:hypothetical protein ElyMa_001843600 [Elysia marginata]|uniref:Uncharacterized protein n=1 Tax=Elysia marginata TaxID=1093978 RepID=A0AAV4EJN1_9GAST|nr:hypothetical protein ElyMa_001843600 [Elysia marginata]
MVSVCTPSDQEPFFKDMMVPPKRERPSTANTMVLVLRPPSEDFKQLAQLTGSEMERTAHRKNRVIQMKLSAYLAEVCQQQRSSARLHKTEEYRFLQEVERRSSVPRSVNMLNQLQQFTRRTFPDAPYSYVDEASVHSRANSAALHRSLPLSARATTRGLRTHHQLLDRPRTSASVLRLTPVTGGDTPDLTNAHVTEESTVSLTRPQTGLEPTADLSSSMAGQHRPITSGQTTELPDIFNTKASEEVDTGGFKTISFTKRTEAERTPNRLERSNSSSSLLTRKRQDSFRRSGTVGKFNISDLPSHEECVHNEGNSLTEVFEEETKMPPLTEINFNLIQQQPEPEESEDTTKTDIPTKPLDTLAVKEETIDLQFSEDVQLGIIDLDQEDSHPTDQVTAGKTSEVFTKKPAKPARKTNFNRIKTEPVMPLRHNITSVLRQERTKYEANQGKIKDYLHKMTSRDFMTRASHSSRDSNSAHSRRSSGPRK